MTLLCNLSPNILDPEIIADLQELGHDNIVELFDIFFNDVMHEISGLRKALYRDDPEPLNRIAHSLRGSSLNLGAAAMGATCLLIEKKAMQNDLDGVELLIEQLDQEFKQARQEMRLLFTKP